MVRNVYAGRVTFHDGVDEIAPGVTVHHIGGHAKGLQSVRVKTRRGQVMLASDAIHLYPHLDEARIFPTTYNLAEVLEGYETLKKLATSRQHIVPGTTRGDETLPRKAGLEDWVVRLDAEPKLASQSKSANACMMPADSSKAAEHRALMPRLLKLRHHVPTAMRAARSAGNDRRR